jgi:hypothetical protein
MLHFWEVLPDILKDHSASSGSSSVNIGSNSMCYIATADVCNQWTPHLYMNTCSLHGYCSWTAGI